MIATSTDWYSFALGFAACAHRSQQRKYTGAPYIEHPVAVATLVASVPHTREMVIAALLHDVIEDCDITAEEIEATFGPAIAALVVELTDVSRPGDGNRAARKRKDRDHLAGASAEAQTIKLADLINNTSTIVEHDPKFAAVYLQEKRELLEVLIKGNRALFEQAMAQANSQ